MNIKYNYWKIFLFSIATLFSCERTSFMESSGLPENITVTNLSYPSIINARAYSKITTAVPTMDSDGVPCGFSIVGVRSEKDGELPSEYLDAVTIASAFMDTIRVAVDIKELGEEQKVNKDGEPVFDENGEAVMVMKYDTTFHDTPVMNPNKAGQIQIAEGNMFGQGDYYFTLSVTPVTDGDQNTQVFEDAFHLNVMPLLPIAINYEPVQQNLVLGEAMATVTPTLKFVKEVPEDEIDVRYELIGGNDTLTINAETGAISLDPNFTTEKNLAITPSVRVISNITEELVEFEGSINALQVVISDEPLILNAGPLLPPAIIYLPYAQNVVIGSTEGTTEVEVPIGNPSLIYELETESDKLIIDSRTGVIKVNPNYNMAEEMMEVYPTIKATSLISYEEALFEGKIKVVISKTPMTLPKSTFNFFFPTLVANDGFSVQGIERGGVGDGLFWKNKKKLIPGKNADAERPQGAAKPHGVAIHNVIYEPTRSPLHDSWMIMDSQNLTQYNSDGYDVKAVFWMKNDLVLYLPDGSVPANMEVYISGNYTGDVTTTEWTQVNDVLKYKVDGQGEEFTGTPQPGENDPTYNQWVRYELDLNGHTSMTDFTLAFRYKTTYDEPMVDGVLWGACSGRFVISYVNYIADEL